MAETKQTLTFDSIMQELKRGHYAPIYLLMGDEPYYIDCISKYIEEHALTPEERDFNLEVVYGADVTVGKVVDRAMSYPMMSQRRVLIVKEAQGVKQMDKMEKYCQNPQKSTVLVLCYKNTTADKRQKWVGAVARNGVVFESKKMREWQLPAFIQKWMAGRHVEIDGKSAEMLADHVGADLNRLTSEMEKLLAALHEDNKRITPELVEKNVGVSKDFNLFELRDAIASKNIYKANLIMQYLTGSQKRENFFIILPSLFSFFQNLMIAFYTPNNTNPDALAAALDLRSKYAAQSYMTAMRNFTAVKTLQIIEKMGEADAKIKGVENPNTSIQDIMKELLFFILH